MAVPRPSTSVPACGRCGPTSRSAPTSSPAFPPRPRRLFEDSLSLVEACGLALSPRVPLLAPAGHAGRADAPGRSRARPRAGRPPARSRRSSAAPSSRSPDRPHGRGADGTWRQGARAGFRAGAPTGPLPARVADPDASRRTRRTGAHGITAGPGVIFTEVVYATLAPRRRRGTTDD